MHGGIKAVADARVGDTITLHGESRRSRTPVRCAKARRR